MMSRDIYLNRICPICDGLPLERLKILDKNDASLPISINLDDIDLDLITQFVSKWKCDLCQALLDLQEHWLSRDANRKLLDNGVDFRSPCGRSQQRMRNTDLSYLGLSVDFDSILSIRVRMRHGHEDPMSERSVQLMKHWIEKCQGDHELCKVSTSSLPTRVIDIGESTTLGTLRLVETDTDQKARYIALSHCWGQCRSFLTTRQSLQDRKNGFSIDELPPTFRDAVLVTKKLGLRYLWIDSICIIQGDKADWEIESARMAGVYEDATLVIAAGNATDDAEGFLRDRQRQYLPIDVISSSTDNSTRIFIEPALAMDDDMPPLDNRAWCLQERYLGQRILFFQAQYLQYQCLQAQWHELGEGIPRPVTSVHDILQQPTDDGTSSYLGWYKMLQHYTTRAISFETDKLPALSAMAERAARDSKDKYLAGLWETDLAFGLLWYRHVRHRFRPNESAAPYSNTGEKPQRNSFIAPSWSWASFPGAISYSVVDPSDIDMKILPRVGCITGEVDVPGMNPFGCVEGGWIEMQAPLLSVQIDRSWVPTVERAWIGDIIYFPELEDFDLIMSSSFDYPKETLGRIFALPLAYAKDETENPDYETGNGDIATNPSDVAWSKVHGILLTPKQSQPNDFERVGCFVAKPVILGEFLQRMEELGSRVTRIV